MNRRRPLHALPVFAASLALAVAQPAAAEIRNVTIEIDPAAPTWQEEVTITVRGEASCQVELFRTTHPIVPGTGSVVRVELEEACLLDPPIFVPFEVKVHVGTLRLGERTVQVVPAGQLDTVLAAASLTVFDVAGLHIRLPEEPVTDAAPFIVSVSGLTSNCLEVSPAEVVDDVILIEWPDGCPILSPPPFLDTYEYEVGPLPAGDYEVRVFGGRGSHGPGLTKAALHVFDAEGCLPDDEVLCLTQDRFAVRVRWTDFEGNGGVGQAMPLRDDTGLFWFFHPDNAELTVKVIDACGAFGHFWVFIAPGSTVEYEVEVTDTAPESEPTKVYRNQLGHVPSLVADTAAFACP